MNKTAASPPKKGERTSELFFLISGQSPQIKKNNSHVRKILLAAGGGVITQ
jgi:hypothetical protein